MLKLGSLYSGVGGVELGFHMSGFKTVWSNEWDKNSCITYRENFNHTLIEGDIWDIDEKKLKPIDVLTAGFPCQAFSVAGYRKGFNEKRGQHFFRILDFIDFHNPPILFLENVKNLKGHDSGNTFKTIKNLLEQRDYKFYFKVINTKDLTPVPQNRERIYIVCFKNQYIGDNEFEFPNVKSIKSPIKDYLDKDYQDFQIYDERFKHYDLLKNTINSTKTIYQWRRKYVRENKSETCPTLTANMGTGGHNVPLIKQGNIIRKLSPRECFRLQGYPENYKLPKIANSHLYKQCGNSVSVPVIKLIADQIKNLVKKI